MRYLLILIITALLLSMIVLSISQSQAQAQELEQSIFDKIAIDKTPKIIQEGGRLVMRELPYYHMVAEKLVADGISYESDDRQLLLRPAEMKYDNGALYSSPSDISEAKQYYGADLGQMIEGRPGANAVGIYYPNVFGLGNNIGILTHRYSMREIESISMMPTFPKDAETLDIYFEISGDLQLDWDYETEKRIEEPVRIGENSWLQPARAWDSQFDFVENEAGHGDYLTNETTIESYLFVAYGHYYYVKRLPVEWLSNAQYPIYTDADITWGDADEFTSDDSHKISVVRIHGSDTRFAVGYSPGATVGYVVKIGEWDGGTGIDWGSESASATTMKTDYSGDICSPSDDIVVISYSNSNEDWKARAVSISGTTVGSWGTEVNIYSTTACKYDVALSNGDTDEFVAFNNAYGDSRYLHGAHCGLSGSPKTTITVNDELRLLDERFQSPFSAQINTDKWIVFGSNTDIKDVRATAVSWDGASLSAGPASKWDSDVTYSKYPFGADSPFQEFGDTDEAVCAYYKSGGWGRAVAVTASGSAVSVGSPTNYLGTGARYTGVAFTDSSNFVITCADDADSSKFFSWYNSLDWSTRTITLGSAEEVDSNACDASGATYLQSGVVSVAYWRESDSSGQARVGSVPAASGGGSPPDITSVSITSVGTSSATANGLITAINGGTPSERGFCYVPCASGTPDYSDVKEFEPWSSGTCSYSLSLSGLSCGSCYHARAYAVTSSGTGYGDVLAFATVPGSGCYTTDVLWLQFEPSQISSGTISDQSSFSNDIYYDLIVNPGSPTITISAIYPNAKSEYEPPDGGQSWYLIGTSPATPDGYISSGTSSDDFEQLPGMEVMNDMLEDTGIPLSLFWMPIIAGLAIVAGGFVFDRTRHLLALALIVNSMMMFCAATGILEWWLIPIYLIFSVGLLIKAESYQTF